MVSVMYEGFPATTVKVVIIDSPCSEMRSEMSRAEAELTVALACDVVRPRLRGGKAPEYSFEPAAL